MNSCRWLQMIADRLANYFTFASASAIIMLNKPGFHYVNDLLKQSLQMRQ